MQTITNFFTKITRSFCCSVLLIAAFGSNAWGWQSIPHLKYDQGPINELSDEIGSLIRLQWSERNIALRQDFPEVDEDAEFEKTVQKYIDRGLDRDRAEQFAMRRGGGGLAVSHPVQKAFNSIAENSRGSRSAGGNGEVYRCMFSNQIISGTCRTSSDSVRIEFAENNDPNQRFVFDDPEGPRVSLLFTSDDLIVEFRQQADGQIRIVVVGDEPHLFTATDYKSLVDDDPLLVQELLQPLFSHLGIVAPFTSHSPEVKLALITQLLAMSDEDSSRVQKELEALESEKEEDRVAAYDRLAEGFEYWENAISDHVTEETISTETRNLLKQIGDKAKNHPANQFINDRKLMSSPSFLVDLLEGRTAEEQELIVNQLKRVTGQDFGDDQKRWKEWIRDRD